MGSVLRSFASFVNTIRVVAFVVVVAEIFALIVVASICAASGQGWHFVRFVAVDLLARTIGAIIILRILVVAPLDAYLRNRERERYRGRRRR